MSLPESALAQTAGHKACRGPWSKLLPYGILKGLYGILTKGLLGFIQGALTIAHLGFLACGICRCLERPSEPAHSAGSCSQYGHGVLYRDIMYSP